jgi:hypothetical protein
MNHRQIHASETARLGRAGESLRKKILRDVKRALAVLTPGKGRR